MAIFTIRDEGNMTATQLLNLLLQGETVEARIGRSEYVYGRRSTHPGTGVDCFAFWGPSGVHCIAVASSDADRVFAHWRGFVEGGRAILAAAAK
jgi:hypothetical protein